MIFAALDALQVKNGAGHSEFRIDEKGDIHIIEIGSRMGGDCIGSHLVPLSTGQDFVGMVVDIALGNAPKFARKQEPMSHSTMRIGMERIRKATTANRTRIKRIMFPPFPCRRCPHKVKIFYPFQYTVWDSGIQGKRRKALTEKGKKGMLRETSSYGPS